MSNEDPGHGLTNRDLKIEGSNAPPPSIAFAFDFPELNKAFEKPDADALAARRMARAFGVTGVMLVLIALMIASAGTLLEGEGAIHGEAHVPSLKDPHTILGLISAALGLAGTILGILGMGKQASRRKWLHARLKTETMRLFHFYYLSSRLPEIVAPPARARDWQKRYAEDRTAALERVQKQVLANPEEELARIIRREGETGFEGFVAAQPADTKGDPAVIADAEAAWLKFRLGWQAEYIRSKLSHKGKKTLTLHQQEKLFGRIGWTCVSLIITLHIVGFFVPFLPPALSGAPELAKKIEVAVILVALFALAWRALEDGFAPAREVERYEQYRGNIRVAIERFEGASTFAAKLEVARAFERTSLEEMRVFMRTQARSRFLL